MSKKRDSEKKVRLSRLIAELIALGVAANASFGAMANPKQVNPDELNKDVFNGQGIKFPLAKEDSGAPLAKDR